LLRVAGPNICRLHTSYQDLPDRDRAQANRFRDYIQWTVSGPLLRFKEGRQVTFDIYNDTDTPEQLHWHGQEVSVDADGAAEEGTPCIPAQGKRRIAFTPRPAGLRFYHTHNRAGANLAAGQYGGEIGPV